MVCCRSAGYFSTDCVVPKCPGVRLPTGSQIAELSHCKHQNYSHLVRARRRALLFVSRQHLNGILSTIVFTQWLVTLPVVCRPSVCRVGGERQRGGGVTTPPRRPRHAEVLYARGRCSDWPMSSVPLRELQRL